MNCNTVSVFYSLYIRFPTRVSGLIYQSEERGKLHTFFAKFGPGCFQAIRELVKNRGTHNQAPAVSSSNLNVGGEKQFLVSLQEE